MPFYHGTSYVAIQHTGGLIARYCEVVKSDQDSVVSSSIKQGSSVRAGQVIAHVGKMHRDSMLHFELYSGAGSGDLTQRNRPPFQRRSDLMDPTSLLDRLATCIKASGDPQAA